MMDEIIDRAPPRKERREVLKTVLRREIAFIVGDRAHGGPSEEERLAALQAELRELEEEKR